MWFRLRSLISLCHFGRRFEIDIVISIFAVHAILGHLSRNKLCRILNSLLIEEPLINPSNIQLQIEHLIGVGSTINACTNL